MRNAKLDKAKRQAVGIYRTVQPLSVSTVYDLETSKRIRDHRGNPAPVIGPKVAFDRKIPEGCKPVYQDTAPSNDDVIAAYLANGGRVKVLDDGEAKGSGELNRKRSMSTPRSRAHMGTFANRSKQAPAAIVRWAPLGQTLIPAAR